MISVDAKLAKHPRVVFQELGGGEGGVLLHLESGQYHSVNESGILIWALVGDGTTLSELIAAMRTHFQDAPPQLEEDVSGFVDDLLQRDLIVNRS